MARLINDLNIQINKEEASFAQQTYSTKESKSLARKADLLLLKNMDQLRLLKLIYPNICCGNDSNIMEKGATSNNISGREARWNQQRNNGL